MLEYEDLIDVIVEHLGALEHRRTLQDGKASCGPGNYARVHDAVRLVVVGAAACNERGILILAEDA